MKKFGKFLLFVFAVASIATGVCYFFKKWNGCCCGSKEEESEPLENDTEEDTEKEAASRTYVPLSNETTKKAEEVAEANQSAFTPLTQQVSNVATETVEEFFDEEDASDVEATI
ncbi:MAG: hypothetical protein LBM69_10100 [Lachnospiraceae bacterium]|jgi:hypothetical protein|nr:hypothetical protein [Lachnospiraceae bacterium]